jgi:hypothetical protein
MNSALRLAHRGRGGGGGRAARWLGPVAIGGFVVAAGVLTWIGVGRGFDAVVSGAPPKATAIVLTGVGNQTTAPFYLAGGTYRSEWAAWGEAAEFPPCTHSAELRAVDPANAATPPSHVTDLAKLVHVPATGGSGASVLNLKPGDYYLDVASACSWQIALSPT